MRSHDADNPAVRHGLLRGKCILLISPEPWKGLQMSKHHWAEALARRGNRVLWLDPPRPTGPRVTLLPGEPVERVSYLHRLRGVNLLPAFVQRWYHGRILRRIEHAAQRKIDIIWSFDTSRFQQLPRGGRRWIMHPVDMNMLGSGHAAFAAADLVLTSSTPILNAVRSIAPNAKVLCVGHGLGPHWFTGNRPDPRPPQGRPLVCCAGNMAIRYLDWEVIAEEVEQHPTVDFRFVGPCAPEPDHAAYRRVRNSPNAVFTGLLGQEAMVHTLQQCDVLLLCYRADLWAEQLSNPHKLLEYLSTGNPIVASYTSEYADAPDNILYMARQRRDHPALLAEVLQGEVKHPDPALRKARIDLARGAGIDALLDRAELALQHQP